MNETDHVKEQLCARIEELEKEKLELNEQLDALQEERDALDALKAENEALRARVAELKKMMQAIKAAAGYRWMNGISDHKLLSDIENMADNAAKPKEVRHEPS